MQIADVWLTRLALEALGLVGAVDSFQRSNPQPSYMRRQYSADACLFPHPSSKGHQAAPGQLSQIQETPLSQSEMEHLRYLQAIYGEDLIGMDGEDEVPVEKNVQRSKVPKDVAVLVGLGLSEAAVFKLMGIAGKVGCRLADVVAVAGASIAKARRVYSYVLKLLGAKKDWGALAARSPTATEGGQSGGTATNDKGEGVAVLSAAEAAHLGAEAHALIGDGCLVDKERGVAWTLNGGLLCEKPLRDLRYAGASRDVPASGARSCDWLLVPWRSTSAGRDLYERKASSLVRDVEDGNLTPCSIAEAVEISISMGNEIAVLKQQVGHGLVLVNEDVRMVWRYFMGRLEQAASMPQQTRQGRAFQWAIQMSDEVERKIARDFAAGRATVLAEHEALARAAA